MTAGSLGARIAALRAFTRAARFISFATAGVVLAGHLTAAAEMSCNETAGGAQAHRYVEQCLEVSPATHPPCNAANACSLIQDEIRRGCALLGKDAPAFCRQDQQQG